VHAIVALLIQFCPHLLIMSQDILSKTIRIGVSECLLGHAVRYDGGDKRNAIVTEVLCKEFECVPVCPEMAIGLGSPRPPVQLVKTSDGIRALGRDDTTIDITDRLIGYARKNSWSDISGFILKSRSPSCGVGSTPVVDSNNTVVALSNGIFADTILKIFPEMPMIEESELEDETLLNGFIRKLKVNSKPTDIPFE
jgi:uncharacterized protein YbbK (DUF523 family)